jgi:uncharacterized protein YegJ (DUF2314 family)
MSLRNKQQSAFLRFSLTLAVGGSLLFSQDFLSAAPDKEPHGGSRNEKKTPQSKDAKDAKDSEEAEEEPEILACVLFLEAPRSVSKQGLSRAIQKGLGLGDADLAEIKISGKQDAWRFSVEGVRYEFSQSDEPWLEDQDQIIHETQDRRMRQMLKKVKASIALSTKNDFKNEDDRSAAEETMVRILSGLVDAKDTLAIYDDTNGDFNYINAEVIDTMRGDDPYSAFDVDVIPAIIGENRDDPKWKAAELEMRRRWPEFAKNFRDNGDSLGPFLVKASFGEGAKRESLWCEVSTIHGGKISAVLKGDPKFQADLSEGDPVDFSTTNLEDWIYPDEEGEKIGAFTLDLESEP